MKFKVWWRGQIQKKEFALEMNAIEHSTQGGGTVSQRTQPSVVLEETA